MSDQPYYWPSVAEWPETRPFIRPVRKNARQEDIPGEAHTNAWDKRSLGLMEAAVLAMAWGHTPSGSVTRNSEEA